MRYLATVQYKGTAYCGWQKQTVSKLPSVQEEIEKILSKILNEDIKIFGSGRTDAGVHALGQVANFKTNSNIEIEKIPYALNAKLKKPIEKIWEYTNQDWKYYIWIHRDQCDGEQTPVSFTFKNECGNSNDCSIGTSLNNWQDNYKMSYDSKENVWYVTIKFPKGRHLYKFCIDGKWVIHPYEELFAEGDIVNNVLNI